MQHSAAFGDAIPRSIVKIEQPRRTGFIDAVHPPLGPERLAPGLILICDAFPARNPRRSRLIIQRNRGLRHIIEQGFQTLMEIGQPMFNPGMFLACADGLIKRIIRARGAEFDAVVLAKPGDSRLVQNDFGTPA